MNKMMSRVEWYYPPIDLQDILNMKIYTLYACSGSRLPESLICEWTYTDTHSSVIISKMISRTLRWSSTFIIVSISK